MVYETIVLIAGSFLIGFIITGFGLGVGLLIVPVFALFFAPAEVNGLVVSMVIIADLFTLHRYWGKQDMSSVITMLPFLVIGIFLGSFILSGGSSYLKLIIGLLCLLFSILELLSIKGVLSFKIPKKVSPIVGVGAGVVSAIAQVGSLPITIYFSQENFTKETFLSTLTMLFFFTNVVKFFSYISFDIIELSTISKALLCIPLIALGSYAGFRANRGLKQESFFTILMVMAIVLSSLVVVFSLYE